MREISSQNCAGRAVDSHAATGIAPVRKGPRGNTSRLPLVKKNGQRDKNNGDNPQNSVLALIAFLVSHVQQYTTECSALQVPEKAPIRYWQRVSIAVDWGISPAFSCSLPGFPGFLREMPAILDAASNKPFRRLARATAKLQSLARTFFRRL